MQKITRWVLLLILNFYILISVFGLFSFAYLALTGISGSSLGSALNLGKLSFIRIPEGPSGKTGNTVQYYISATDPGLLPATDSSEAPVAMNEGGSLRKNPFGKGHMTAVSATTFRWLLGLHILFYLVNLALLVYIMILLVKFTQTTMTSYFMVRENGILLRRIGILILMMALLEALTPDILDIMAGRFKGTQDTQIPSTSSGNASFPYNLVAGLLLILIADAFRATPPQASDPDSSA